MKGVIGGEKIERFLGFFALNNPHSLFGFLN